MGIGGGIALIVVGLVFLLNVIEVDIPGIDEHGLGVILAVAGVVFILLNLTLWREAVPWSARRRTTIVERDVPPGRI